MKSKSVVVPGKPSVFGFVACFYQVFLLFVFKAVARSSKNEPQFSEFDIQGSFLFLMYL